MHLYFEEFFKAYTSSIFTSSIQKKSSTNTNKMASQNTIIDETLVNTVNSLQ